MGNKQSKSYKPPSFKRENWHLIPSFRRNHRPEHGLSYVYRNNLTSQQLEQYQIYFHNQAEYQKYLQFFEWREREDTIVNTKFINSEETKQFCNTNHNARIYIEHVPVRLSDIEDIPFPENLYVLFSCLDGFEKLFHFVGYFRIEQDFVCIDRDGRVKVWLNSDLSKCHTIGSQFSDETSNFYDSELYQEQMVGEIIEMIQKNTAEEIEASMTFTQHLWKNGKQRLNFKQAKQEIIAYAKLNNTQLPNYFESVLSVFNEERPSELEEGTLRQEQVRRDEAHVYHQDRQTSRTNPQLKVLKEAKPNQEVQRAEQRSARVEAKNTNVPYAEMTTENLFRPNSQTTTLIYRQNSEVRPHSPAVPIRQPFVTKSAIHPQVKFNYGSGFGAASMYVAAVRPNPQTMTTNFSTVIQSHATQPLTKPLNQQRPLIQPFSHQRPPTKPLNQQRPIQRYPPVFHTPNAPQSQSSGSINEAVRDVVLTNKLLYSDTTQTYELDQQIVKDIIKYFG